MSAYLDDLLDAERAREIAKNDDAMRAEDARRAPAEDHASAFPSIARALIGGIAAAAALSACAAAGSQVAEAECVQQRLVPIVVGDQVYMAAGHCIEWSFGPSKQQQQQFEQAHGFGGSEQ